MKVRYYMKKIKSENGDSNDLLLRIIENNFIFNVI